MSSTPASVDPTNSNRVYATTAGCYILGGFIWKSVDGGSTWSSGGRTRGLNTGFYTPIVIDPQSPDTLYAGLLSGISKSENGGETWSNIGHGLPQGFVLSSLVIDPQFPSRFYAGSFIGSGFDPGWPRFGVFMSTDRGASWTPVHDGMGDQAIHDLAISSRYPKIAYAATEYQLFKLTESVVDSPHLGDTNGDGKSDILWRNG